MVKRFFIFLLVLVFSFSVFAIKIGVTTITLRHAFFQAINAGIIDAANKLEDVEVIVFDPDLSLEKQINAMEDFIVEGVDGIILIAVDNYALIPVVEEAAKKKIPVITVDAPVKTDAVTTFIGTENYNAGYELGLVAKEYINKNLNGSATIAIVRWLESQVQIDRTEGFKEALKDMKNVTFVGEYQGYDRDESFKSVSDLLVSNPDIDIIFAPAENSVVGAHAALETMNRLDVKIFGFDMTEEAIRGIKDGSIVAMVQQQPYLEGIVAVQSVMIKLKGEKELGSNWLPSKRFVPVIIYTQENIDEYKTNPTSPSK